MPRSTSWSRRHSSPLLLVAPSAFASCWSLTNLILPPPEIPHWGPAHAFQWLWVFALIPRPSRRGRSGLSSASYCCQGILHWKSGVFKLSHPQQPEPRMLHKQLHCRLRFPRHLLPTVLCRQILPSHHQDRRLPSPQCRFCQWSWPYRHFLRCLSQVQPHHQRIFWA